MNLPTFEQFHIELEGKPVTADHRIHTGGHDAIGGEMTNFYSSPAGSCAFFFFFKFHNHLQPFYIKLYRPTFSPPPRKSGSNLVELAANAPYSTLRYFWTFNDNTTIRKRYSCLWIRDGTPCSNYSHSRHHEYTPTTVMLYLRLIVTGHSHTILNGKNCISRHWIWNYWPYHFTVANELMHNDKGCRVVLSPAIHHFHPFVQSRSNCIVFQILLFQAFLKSFLHKQFMICPLEK